MLLFDISGGVANGEDVQVRRRVFVEHTVFAEDDLPCLLTEDADVGNRLARKGKEPQTADRGEQFLRLSVRRLHRRFSHEIVADVVVAGYPRSRPADDDLTRSSHC